MVDRHKHRVVVKWVAFVIALNVFQLGLFTVDDETAYWNMYDTTTDLIAFAFASALYVSIPFSAVRTKMITAIVFVWHLYCMISQFIIDYLIDDPVNGYIGGALVVALMVTLFLARFLFTWSPDETEPELGCFYEVIGKPTNLSQLVVAMYSGRGGAFGITDGVHLWHYSKPHNSMVCEKLGFGYVKGRMVKKICVTSKEKYNELDAMTGQRFTLMHNCLQLHALSGRWQ